MPKRLAKFQKVEAATKNHRDWGRLKYVRPAAPLHLTQKKQGCEPSFREWFWYMDCLVLGGGGDVCLHRAHWGVGLLFACLPSLTSFESYFGEVIQCEKPN